MTSKPKLMLCVLCVLQSPVRTVFDHISSTQTVSSCPPRTHTILGNFGGCRKQTLSLVTCGLQNGIFRMPRSASRPLSSGGAIFNQISSLLTKSKSRARLVKCKRLRWRCLTNVYKSLLVSLLVLIVTAVLLYI